MKYTNNALNILTVRTYPKKGPAWINKNLNGNESEETLYRLLGTDEYEFNQKRERIKNDIEKLGTSTDGIVAIGDPDFPFVRGNVKGSDQPYALFYKGDISLLNRENLNFAVIGVSTPDDKVAQTETMVVKEIVKYNATIVSGLALGCDTIAHKTALENGAKTIAILPSALNAIYPKENSELANIIVEQGGLLISEYYEAPSCKNDQISRFIVRDRLQSLFSDGILLAASYAPNASGNKCGSRHAMSKAKDYGIKRSVIYNDAIHSNESIFDLNRQILEEDRTVICIDPNDMTDTIKKLIDDSMLHLN